MSRKSELKDAQDDKEKRFLSDISELEKKIADLKKSNGELKTENDKLTDEWFASENEKEEAIRELEKKKEELEEERENYEELLKGKTDKPEIEVLLRVIRAYNFELDFTNAVR